MNSKLISENLTAMEAQSLTGLPTVKTASLRGGILLSLIILTLIFWGGLFSAIQLQDRRDSDFPDPLEHYSHRNQRSYEDVLSLIHRILPLRSATPFSPRRRIVR
jgi:hypothetical protein